MKIKKLNEEYKKGEWVEVNLNTKKNGTPNIIPVKVDKELYHGKSFLGWAWGERQHEYPMSAIVNRIDGDDTTEIIRRYSLKEDINVDTIGDYITDHYDFDDIDDKYSCINSIRDSFKDKKTISKEELEQFIGAHNGKDKVNESKFINENKSVTSEFDNLITPIKDKYPEVDFIINAHTKLGCEIVADSNQERDIAEDEIIKITTGTKFKYIQSADRLNKSRGHRAYVNIIFDFGDTSLTESRATHCVYFNQDGIDQIEFEGTEDECNRYISDIQAEQDDEFGDEAPERFIKRLNESVDTAIEEGPKEGPEFGLSSLLNEAIQEELKTVDFYNSIAITARDSGYEDIAKLVDEINTEENKHIGQLQEALKSISPNAIAIEDGAEEGQEQLSDTTIFDDDLNDDELGMALFKLR